jgi:DNA-directed RNA polymerase subunit RPC12/RpoP
MANEKLLEEFINPRKIKWTIYGSYLQFAAIFFYLFFSGFWIKITEINPMYLISWGIIMSFFALHNTRSKYGKLDVALSVQPLYCPECRHKRVAMLPVKYKCPECESIFDKDANT